MKIVFTIASTRLDHGGTSRCVPAWCNAFTSLGLQWQLITTLPKAGMERCYLPSDLPNVRLLEEQPSSLPKIHDRRFAEEIKQISACGNEPHLIHDNGIWLPCNHSVAVYCRQHKLTRIVSPHGMLGQWAFARSKWKKRFAWMLYQKRDLESATAFHATSEQEANEIRKLGLSQPIAIIPYSVEFPSELPPRQDECSKSFLFLSRIHPKKGVENLVHAWHRSGVFHNGWRLIIAGPGDTRYLEEINKLIQTLEVQSSVSIRDEVSDRDKWALYASCSVFILPSFNENFGIVIAEALAAELPVITSKGTPWQEILKQDAGWWIENDVDTVARTIIEAANTPLRTRKQMGERGANWVRKAFGAQQCAARLYGFYKNCIS